MNYELAKQLKEAGFPFNPHRDWEHSDFAWLPCFEITKQEREKLWIPTLSELIEACGEYFISLTRARVFATGEIYWQDMRPLENERFTTPEEAVANLWLAINKK